MRIGNQVSAAATADRTSRPKAGVHGTENVSFQDTLRKTGESRRTERTSETAKVTESAVDDYKRRHPGDASVIDDYVRAGRKVLADNHADQADRSGMTMEEYRLFFTELMESIPYDGSQSRDVNVWTVTEAGWEQMKNDPDYEAWVLGYTYKDRSFHNPWASVPGYAPHFHTERFGASIDEHLGQSGPMDGTGARKGGNEESWWEIRHRKFLELMAELPERPLAKMAAGKMS